ncbi:MAG: hypothetical protein Q8N63_02920 [Nanoarchaeota archaeon]|nr:hypothetical protein [Nanoarchaeota archaeon]
MAIENRYPDYEKLNIEHVIMGINSAPLSDEIKQKAITVIKEKSQRIESLLETGRYQAPEIHFEMQIANFVMEMIRPVLESHNVPLPNGRDTTRYIYDALGGRQAMKYEVLAEQKTKMTKLSQLLKIIAEENARKIGLGRGSYNPHKHSERNYLGRGSYRAGQEDHQTKAYMQSKSPNKRGYAK